MAEALTPIETWFARRGWTPMDFQRQCWQAYLRGESGLLQVPTGSGKTYAAVMGPIAAMLAESGGSAEEPAGLRLLVITPLRALSRDLALAIEEPIGEMGWPLRVAIRNGDTASHERNCAARLRS
jgi:ATP-dependent Lhr-like helicase